MSTPKKKAAIIAVTRRDGDYEAHIQMRGVRNYYKDTPNSWPGIYNATAEGKIRASEDVLSGLRREAQEELNHGAGEFIFRLLLEEKKHHNLLLLEEGGISIYYVLVTDDFFKEPKDLPPGDIVDVTDTFALPAGLGDGQYTLSAGIVDGETPVLRLGIKGRGDEGWYPLSKVDVVK